MKFCIFEEASIKLLRRAQNYHRYHFTTIPIAAATLEAEENRASQRLNSIFKDMEKQLAELKNNEIQDKKYTMNAAIKSLTEEGDEKQVQ